MGPILVEMLLGSAECLLGTSSAANRWKKVRIRRKSEWKLTCSFCARCNARSQSRYKSAFTFPAHFVTCSLMLRVSFLLRCKRQPGKKPCSTKKGPYIGANSGHSGASKDNPEHAACSDDLECTFLNTTRQSCRALTNSHSVVELHVVTLVYDNTIHLFRVQSLRFAVPYTGATSGYRARN